MNLFKINKNLLIYSCEKKSMVSIGENTVVRPLYKKGNLCRILIEEKEYEVSVDIFKIFFQLVTN